MQIVKAEPGKTRVGWIGTGVMGRWMCQHLMSKGYAATVFTRTKSKAQPLLDAGATYADSPKAVAEHSDMVFAIVGFPPDVREVFLGPTGALAGSRPGSVLVDMTTRALPGRAPASAPWVPRNTSRTSFGKPTMAKTTSAFSATARGLSAQAAPASSSGRALSRLRL